MGIDIDHISLPIPGAFGRLDGGVPGAQLCVRACGRRVSVADVRESERVRVVSASGGNPHHPRGGHF